jgi:hypothetical protein
MVAQANRMMTNLSDVPGDEMLLWRASTDISDLCGISAHAGAATLRILGSPNIRTECPEAGFRL